MKLAQCEREQEVVDAVRSGRWGGAWGEEIRRHAATCAVCAEVALAAQAFQPEAERAEAELLEPGASLPSAGLVWWRAQLAARRAAEQRAAQPIVLVERISWALGAFVTLGLGVWQWARIADWVRRAPSLILLPHSASSSEYSSGSGLHHLAQGGFAQTPLFLLATGAAFLALMVFTAYLAWRED